jgi:hypothetical protein
VHVDAQQAAGRAIRGCSHKNCSTAITKQDASACKQHTNHAPLSKMALNPTASKTSSSSTLLLCYYILLQIPDILHRAGGADGKPTTSPTLSDLLLQEPSKISLHQANPGKA